MSTAMIIVLIAFVGTLILQAVFPNRRQVIVVAGCAICAMLAVGSGATEMKQLWQHVPWNVVAILVALSLFTQLVLPSNIMGFLAVKASGLSRGKEARLLWVFPAMMFVLSGTVNNLAAMNVVLPVVLAILAILSPQQRYLDMLLASLLVACNLGGASTPIGDFPAILLMGHGGVSFTVYLIWALPVCIVILGLVQLAFYGLHRIRAVERTAFEESLAVATIQKLYRRTEIDWPKLIPALLVFAGMFVFWMIGAAPDLVCLVGVGALLVLSRKRGESAIRNQIEVEPVVFLISLFVMIAAVTSTGILDVLVQPIVGLSDSPQLMLAVFMITAGVLTGLFSAGPSMAALLPVADVLTEYLPPEPVYVGLALAVCAGSSLFITAATSGVLAQEYVDASGMATNDGRRASFGFLQFLPYGALSFMIILTSGIAYVVVRT